MSQRNISVKIFAKVHGRDADKHVYLQNTSVTKIFVHYAICSYAAAIAAVHALQIYTCFLYDLQKNTSVYLCNTLVFNPLVIHYASPAQDIP